MNMGFYINWDVENLSALRGISSLTILQFATIYRRYLLGFRIFFLFHVYPVCFASKEPLSVPRIVLRRHCTENSKQTFPEMKLRGLVPIRKFMYL